LSQHSGHVVTAYGTRCHNIQRTTYTRGMLLWLMCIPDKLRQLTGIPDTKLFVRCYRKWRMDPICRSFSYHYINWSVHAYTFHI